MLEYLAFDQKTIKNLLGPKNNKEFSPDFPLFYKDKTGKSALDQALNANLLQVVEIMLDYIDCHQNNYAFTNLISDIFVNMMEKGIKVYSILNTNLSLTEIIYNEWPEKSF